MKIMIEILILASIAAAGILFIVFKFGRIRRVLAFDILVDVVATTLLCLGMAGTFTGIMIGLTAGTIISVTLFMMKKVLGAESWTRKGWVDTPRPHNDFIATMRTKL
jgi:fructose-1,6-bisphosphatase/sedoheptulose 1,7-bisphosphatase-like protein